MPQVHPLWTAQSNIAFEEWTFLARIDEFHWEPFWFFSSVGIGNQMCHPIEEIEQFLLGFFVHCIGHLNKTSSGGNQQSRRVVFLYAFQLAFALLDDETPSNTT